MSFRLTILFLLLALTGCRLTGDVYREQPDPDAASFVTITKVTGRTFTLSDGRKFELAGVDYAGLSSEQAGKFDAQLQGHLLPTGNALVFPQPHGRSRIEIVGGYRAKWGCHHFCDPWTLFPTYVKIYPEHRDAGSELVSNGIVRALPDEMDPVPDPLPKNPHTRRYFGSEHPSWAELVRRAEKFAQEKRVGIWITPQEELARAALNGDFPEMQKQLAAGAKINGVAAGGDFKDMTALTAVAGSYAYTGDKAKSRIEVMRWLLDQGADPNIQGRNEQTSLQLVNDFELIDLLLHRGANWTPRDGGYLLARVAADCPPDRSIGLLTFLTDQGVIADGKHFNGTTALMCAARNGRVENAAFLIARGADVNAKTSDGKTAFAFARENKRVEMVELLRKHGAVEK